MQKSKSLWVGLFLLLFLLTQDYLFISWPQKTTLAGFPIWLIWFVAIHAIFVLIFFFFAKHFWKK